MLVKTFDKHKEKLFTLAYTILGTHNFKGTEQSSLAGTGEKGETRDIVAKIIGWGTGGKNSGKDYSLGRSALKEADRLSEEGNEVRLDGYLPYIKISIL